MGLTLSSPPGFADVSDAALAHDQPAFGFNLARISDNAAFAMSRTECFQGLYQNGDTVPTPVSPIDGYAYSRNELIYIWAVQNSVDKASGWITGPGSLWYAGWLVDQSTGEVFSDEWYRESGSHGASAHTNDGTLFVWTIAQRGLVDLLVAASPSYAGLTGSTFGASDKPLTELLAQGLNDGAKAAVIFKEVFYLGTFINGDIVPTAISPADGYHYSYAEMKFLFSWRWTFGSINFNAPPMSYGQLGPMQASVSSVGAVSISETYVDNSGNTFTTGDGRLAVFAFCRRSGTPGSITPTANSFLEIPFEDFLPGTPLPYTVIQQIVKNIQEGLLTPEFFGPTTHQNGDTIGLPTSSVDGYAYSRSELTYLWTWTDTTPAAGSHVRVEAFHGLIDSATGAVHLGTYRLPPGGPADTVGDATLPRISVIIFARRNAHAAIDPGSVSSIPGAAASSNVTDIPVVSTVAVNGVALPHDPNFSDTTPAAPSGKTNVKWQNDALSPTDASAYMPLLVGDSGSGGTSGAVPAPAAGDAAAGKFLKADGTWEPAVSPQQVQQELQVYAVDTGTANAYAVALSPAPTIIAGSVVVFKALHSNTGASTLAVNGGLATPINKNGSTALTSGDINAGQIIEVVFDGTNFQIIGGSTGGGSSSSSLVLGFVINNGAVGNNVAAMLVAPRVGTVSKCVIVTKASDGTTGLTVRIKQNGTDVFTSDPTVASGTASGTVSSSTSLTANPLSVAAGDVFQIDILGGTPNWAFTAQLET